MVNIEVFVVNMVEIVAKLVILCNFLICSVYCQSEVSVFSRFTSSKCVGGQFDCGEKCIPLHKFRDCNVDCLDAADEACWGSMVKCDGCKCVDAKDAPAVCNDISGYGQKLCRSNRGKRTIYKCKNDNCVLYKWISDGSNDCGDWSDEDACTNGLANCPAGTVCRFQIPNRLFCDCPHGFEYDSSRQCVPVTITTAAPAGPTLPDPLFPTFDPPQCQQGLNSQQPSPASLAFVIDCSSTMQQDLESLAKAFAAVLFPFIEARPGAINSFILIAVKEGLGTMTITESPLRLLQSVQQLTVQGGGTQCSRALLPSIRQALVYSNLGSSSTVVVLTDGQISDPTLAQSVITQAIQRKAHIHFLVTGTCPVPSLASEHAMETIVNVANGHIFNIGKTTNDYVNSLYAIVGWSEPEFAVLHHVTASADQASSSVSVQLPLDDNLMAVSMLITGSQPTIILNSPASSYTSQEGTNLMLINWLHPTSVGQLDLSWADTQRPYQLTIFSVAQVQFNFKFTVNPEASSPVFSDTPWFGPSTYIVVGILNVAQPDAFVVDRVTVQIGSHTINYSGIIKEYTKLEAYQYIVGPFKFGCLPFHIQVGGTTPCGSTFQRASTTGFLAQDIDVSSRIPGQCAVGQFECSPNTCVDVNKIRNDVIDCISGIDEVKIKTDANCAAVNVGPVLNPSRDDPSWCLKVDVFRCVNGVQCIPQVWVNDGVPDCSDASDEDGTVPPKPDPDPNVPVYDPPPNEPPTDFDVWNRVWNNSCELSNGYMFQCTDGTCIPMQSFRDCTANCKDNSDEVCFYGHQKCDDCRCALPSDVQLGDYCVNRDVENECNRAGMYPCKSKDMCVFIQNLLDGVIHCPDGSDEDPSYLDECYLGVHSCSQHAVCTNVPGGAYKCVCMFGFHGDGHMCSTPHGISSRDSSDVGGLVREPNRGDLNVQKPK